MSSESDSEGDRIQSILALAPRRFHISANPPFGAGFVIFGHENEDISEDELENFILQNDAIKNCKPGIWTSLSRAVENPGPDGATHPGDADREHILRWVCEGTIDISQSVEEWKAYEEATRKSDAEVKVSQIVPKGTKWRRWGTYYDDGGVCTIVSGDYITHDAARSIMFGDKDSTEELEFGYYLETLSLNGTEIGTSEDQHGLTIGGLNFYQDAVGGPPKIAVAEENGQVIAVRFYCGDDDWTSDGSTDGLSSEEEGEDSEE